MTDFVMVSATQDEMYAFYDSLGMLATDDNDPPNVIVMLDKQLPEGACSLINQGARYITVEGVDGPEQEQVEGYWAVLRWAAPEPFPDFPADVTVNWRSDDPDAGDYPEGVTMFA